MFTRSKLMVALAVGTLAVSAGFGAILINLTAPTSTAQVGVAYTSAIGGSGGNSPYTFTITVGSLPNGLSLNTNTGAITGTPTIAGIFNFTAQATDTPFPSGANPDSMSAAHRRPSAANGTPLASGTSAFTITVAAAPSPTPVPPSIWMAMLGLAGAGFFRMRQMRRA
jgi:hypothetical protein